MNMNFGQLKDLRLLPAVAGMAALVAGCAVGPDFHHPDAKPPNGYTAEKLDLQAAAGNEASLTVGAQEKVSP